MKIVCILLCGLCGLAQAQPMLSEQAAVALALEQNFSIRIAQNNQLIAERNATKGQAGMYPTVTLNAGVNQNVQRRTQLAFTNPDFNDSLFTRPGVTSNNLNLTPTASWVVFAGLSTRAFYDQLKQIATNSDIATRQAIEDVVAQVLAAYYDIVQRQKVLAVREGALAISDARVRLAENREAVGAGSKLDLLQAKADYNTDKSNLIRQRLAVQSAKISLNLLLARAAEDDFAVADTIQINEGLEMSTLNDQGQQRNLDLQQATGNIALSRTAMKQLQGALFPTITLNANLQYFQQNASPFAQGFNVRRFFAESNTAAIGATLSWTIFNGGRVKRGIENAKLQLRNAELQLAQQELNFRADLARAYQSYRNSLELLHLEQENLQVAQKNVEVALERYKIGGSTALELRTAQNTYIDAQSRLMAALYAAKLAETDLLRLSGQFAQIK